MTLFLAAERPALALSTYTSGMTVSSQNLLNHNFNPVQYDGVNLLATNPLPFKADLWVNSAVNMRLGGPQSIFTSMTWTNSGPSRVTSSIAGVDLQTFEPVQGRAMYIQNLSIYNVALDPEGTVQTLRPFSAPVEIFFQPANGSSTSLTLSNAFLNAGAGIKGDATPGAHFTLAAPGASNEITSWNPGRPFGSPTTLLVTNGSTLQFFRCGETASGVPISRRLYFGETNNSLLVTGPDSTLLIDQSYVVFKTNDPSVTPTDFVVNNGAQISLTGSDSHLNLPILTLDNGSVHMGLNTYLTPAQQLYLTSNSSIFAAEGSKLRTPVIAVQSGSSTITIVGYASQTGVTTGVLTLRNGAALTLQGDGIMAVTNGYVFYSVGSNEHLNLLGGSSLILSGDSSFNPFNESGSLFLEKTSSNSAALILTSGSAFSLSKNLQVTNNGIINVTGDNSLFNVFGAGTISGTGALSIDSGALLRFGTTGSHPKGQGVLITSNSLELGFFSTTSMTIDPQNRTNDTIVVGGNLSLNNLQLANLSLAVTNDTHLPSDTRFLLFDHTNSLPVTNVRFNQNFDGLPNGKVFGLGQNIYEILYNDTNAGAVGGYGITLTTVGLIYNSYWSTSRSGNWTNNPYWGTVGTNIGVAPGLDGTNSYWDTATFDTRGLTSGTGTVTLNTNAFITSMIFSNAAASYVVDGTGTITMSKGNNNPSITNAAGKHTINATLNLSTNVSIQTAPGTGLTLGGPIIGPGGLTKSGAGTLSLSGTNTYSGTSTIGGGTFQILGTQAGGGALNVNGGTFQLLGSYTGNGSITISSAATFLLMGTHTGGGAIALNGGLLTGTGSTTSRVTVNPGGVITPGISSTPGALSVGSLVMNTGGLFNVLIGSQTAVGKIIASGKAVVGGTLNAIAVNGWNLNFGDRYQVMQAGGGISGAFANVVLPQGYRGLFLVENGGTSGVLTIAPQSYTQFAVTRNQLSIARALNTFALATSGDKQVVSFALDSLPANQYQNAFNEISPTFYQSMATIAFNQANAQYNALVERAYGLRVGGVGFSMSGFPDNTMILEGQGDGDKDIKNSKDILRPGADNHWGMFVDGNGIFAQANSANMLPNYNAQSGGVNTGLTYSWNDCFSSGLYAGYEGTYAKYSGGSRLIDNAVRFGLFGTYGAKDGRGFYADGLIGGGYNNYSVSRNIQFGTINRTASSSPGAGELDSLLAAGYNIRKGNWNFGPVSSLQYTYFGMNPFSETGAQSLNLQGLGWNSSSLVYNLGANCAYAWQATRDIMVVPQINMAWQHEFLQNPYSINGSLGGQAISNWSATPLRDTLYTGVGVTVQFGKRWNTSLFYNAAAGNQNLVSQNVFWMAGVRF